MPNCEACGGGPGNCVTASTLENLRRELIKDHTAIPEDDMTQAIISGAAQIGQCQDPDALKTALRGAMTTGWLAYGDEYERTLPDDVRAVIK